MGPTRTPPLKRRELNMKRNPDLERGLDTKTPEPPPPPTRMTYPPNTIKEPECEFPPPPESDTKSKLSEESVGQISEENKENIVKQWVESTTQSAEEIAKELEKFAYDIAETVVSNMEKNSEKKESYGTHSHQAIATASSHEETQKTQASGGMYFAAPATTSHRELHGPVYVQEENRRVGMTFQQEERRREELRKQEEAKQEEKRRCEIELEAQQLQEEQQRKIVEMRERQQKLLLQKQEEERKRQFEFEEKTRQEEFQRAEEQRLKQQELKKIEEEKKRQEILRFEKLKQEEELKRQEEARLEQEMRRQFEMQQQLDIQRKKEQQLLLEQQQLEIQRQQEQQQLLMQQQQLEIQHQREEQQQMEIQHQREEQKRMDIERQRDQQLLLEQQKIQQESISVRDHIPKIAKTKSFEASQDRQEVKHEDHLSLIKTGQVNEKRNFWIRSTSADRLNQVSLSPAPRRRRIDWNANKQKENDDPESRPGSSLGQANTGSVRNLSSGFIAKSKSSAAVMQDELERGRPKQKSVIANGWTKEQYDQKIKQDFLKSQEVKTNKVTDTVQTWGKRDSSQTGRTTPAPSRNIGEGFSENRVGKTSEVDKNANSWRTKTPEPTLKLVNVSVEKAIGSTQNIHISENAHKQMASFMTSSTVQQKEEVMNTVMTNTMSSQSSVTSHSMSTTSRCSADINTQPPPTPERNQGYGGKCENTIKPKTEPIRNEPTKTHSDATIDTVVQTSTEASVTDMTANIEQSVKTVSSNKESVKTISPPPVSRQDQIQQAIQPSPVPQTIQQSNVLQNSTSMQSINSVLSTCSSSALPEPVKQGWFDEMEHLSTTSNSSYAIPDGVLSPTGTGKTPLPVVANWFDALEAKMTKPKPEKPVRNEQVENKPNVVVMNEKVCPDKTTSLLNEILDELVIDESALELTESSGETGTMKRKQAEHAKSFISDDVDNRSVKSDATVIEIKDSEKEESVIFVPQSPREIRKKFQAASSFERSFTKSSDLELSKEFKEGMRGKVKEARDSGCSSKRICHQAGRNGRNQTPQGFVT